MGERAVGTFGEAELSALVALNRRRSAPPSPGREHLERYFASRFGADRRLAVYGTLAPGRSNHDQVADLHGRWVSGWTVRGELLPLGWGRTLGYPGLRWAPEGPPVAVELFVSDDLPAHWARLDAFEGPEYRRILVPVFDGEVVVEVANLYEAVDEAVDENAS